MNPPFPLCCALAVILCIANAAKLHNEDALAMAKAPANLHSGRRSRKSVPVGLLYLQVPGQKMYNNTADVAVDEYGGIKIPREGVIFMAESVSNARRFSKSWERIFPEGSRRADWAGVAYCNSLLDYLVKKGRTRYNLPLAIQEKYKGWLSLYFSKLCKYQVEQQLFFFSGGSYNLGVTSMEFFFPKFEIIVSLSRKSIHSLMVMIRLVVIPFG